MEKVRENIAEDVLFDSNVEKFVIMRLDGQLFGMQVEDIEDILLPHKITPIPLAPPEVMGTLNLRGRIVTSIDLRVKLGHPPLERNKPYKSIVIGYQGELYSIAVDEVSEVKNINNKQIKPVPENISNSWKKISCGLFSMDKELMVILDSEKLLGIKDISINDDNKQVGQ